MAVSRREFCWSVVATAAATGCAASEGSGQGGPGAPGAMPQGPGAGMGGDGVVPGADGGTGDGNSPPAPLPEVGEQPAYLFDHGIASGDPLPDRVILWTRLTPESAPESELGVDLKLYAEPGLTTLLQHHRVFTSQERDFTVKLDVQGLTPSTTYYYRFEDPTDPQSFSAVGRTRTLATGSVERARFAVVSCSCYSCGYFNAYAHVAQRNDLDVVLHLGDYIYEYGSDTYNEMGIDRGPEPSHEILTLEDYRTRHAQYKRDPDLAEAHRQHAFITIWDDHETANDAWSDGAQNHDSASEGSYAERRRAALRAYREWMPIREIDPDDLTKIYRSFAFGDLFDLMMLETRTQRSEQDAGATDDPSRTLLGEAQERWLFSELTQSQSRGATWRLLGQQMMLAQVELGGQPLNADQWDGYNHSRQRLYDHIEAEGIDNFVVLTGDIHSSWAVELARDPFGNGYDGNTSEGALGVELVCTSVTSPALDGLLGNGLESLAGLTHPHLRWLDVRHRGYLLVDVDHTRLVGEWYHSESVLEPNPALSLARAFRVDAGKARLQESDQRTAPFRDRPPTV